MKYLLALSFLFLLPQSPEKFPPLGTIDPYGNRTVSAAEIREALPFHEGDAMQDAAIATKKHAAKQKLEAIPGIKSAFLSRICCTQDHKSMLYVGVEEAFTYLRTSVAKARCWLSAELCRTPSRFARKA